MAKKTYSEKLQDPRWQRKRLEIMGRDDFKCVRCKDDKSTLNVHHKTYKFGKEPWDYEDTNFLTLCKFCHEIEHIDFHIQNYGILSAEEFVDSNPRIRVFFSSISNQKGIWELTIRKGLDLNDIPALSELLGYVIKLKRFIEAVDNHISIITCDGVNASDVGMRINFYDLFS